MGAGAAVESRLVDAVVAQQDVATCQRSGATLY